VSGSTFSANTAKNGGGSISNSHIAWAAADIFNGGCHEAARGDLERRGSQRRGRRHLPKGRDR
jgi:hypothetical protein